MTEAPIIYLLCKSLDWFLYDRGLRLKELSQLVSFGYNTTSIEPYPKIVPGISPNL